MNKRRSLPQQILEFDSKANLENYLKNLSPERLASSCVTVVNPTRYVLNIKR